MHHLHKSNQKQSGSVCTQTHDIVLVVFVVMLHVQTEHWFACQVARQPPTHPASRDWTKAEKAVIMEEARASLSHYMPLRGRGSRRQHGWLDRFKAGSIPVTATSTKLHVQEEVRRLQGEKGGRQGGGGGVGARWLRRYKVWKEEDFIILMYLHGLFWSDGVKIEIYWIYNIGILPQWSDVL